MLTDKAIRTKRSITLFFKGNELEKVCESYIKKLTGINVSISMDDYDIEQYNCYGFQSNNYYEDFTEEENEKLLSFGIDVEASGDLTHFLIRGITRGYVSTTTIDEDARGEYPITFREEDYKVFVLGD